MIAISRIPWKNSGVEIINDIDVNNIHFWLNEKHIKTGLGHSNLQAVTNKYDPKYRKS